MPTRRRHPSRRPPGDPCSALAARFPPSPPCDCEICRAYCQRPGWWSVAEAKAAVQAGFGARMMLEIAPERTFGVLAPAFRGCEGGFALQQYAGCGCTFLQAGHCELHGTGLQPLECRFCHHERVGLGMECHTALEADWQTPAGRCLVARWSQQAGLWPHFRRLGLAKLME